MEIRRGISIPDEELEFKASRSGGPGGQNVNKVNSRVALRFNVLRSSSLSAEQKHRILTRLAKRISTEGVLRVVSRRSRSQAANREAAEERLAELLRFALEPARPRHRTAIPPAARRSRLEEKRYRSRLKRERAGRRTGEE